MKKINNAYCVGDIHGWLIALKELLDAVDFDYNNDQLISLGDLCDRGPDSWGVVDLLLKIKNLVLIQGNHDIWMKEHLSRVNLGESPDMGWLSNGGIATLDSYKRMGWADVQEHEKLYNSALPYYVEDNVCFVHGGFDREWKIAEQHPGNLCWDRELVDQMMSCNGGQKLRTADNFDEIFIGHTPTLCWYETKPGTGNKEITTPIIKGGVVNLDTGCGKGGPLTLWNLKTREWIQTKKVYSH